ncbi:MAG TPA: efflux RND transporter periplasmic adaptor subunit, partial [Chitinophagaceae bacterium]|nr:efflux RND transporter periplasmic adaptor subunit [Chitinophagaceae bacterium]
TAMQTKIKQTRYIFHLFVFIITAAFILYACKSSTNNAGYGPPPPQALPVIAVSSMPATTYQEYSASLEGSKDIEVRPEIDGYIEKIFVDEGAHVRKGQSLFQINSRTYLAQLNNAKASLAAAKANLANAQINVSKLTPLVQNNVISDVQLKTAQAAYDAAAANVSQAESVVRNAEINLGYTMIKAPVDGYIGRIPHKTGSLVGTTTQEPLTVISEIKKVYAYFSLSENDFFQFKNQFAGKTVEEKIKQMPPVELVLADGSVYPEKGKVEVVSGQFNNTIGSISFRASFENKSGLLRSGNTGKVRIPRSITSALIIPQEATFELQDKIFVFAVGDSNKVTSKPLTIAGTSGNYYLVQGGINPGEKIVYTGLDRLRDGAVIQPQPMSMDSLLKARPM